jgi:hypothetical protein
VTSTHFDGPATEVTLRVPNNGAGLEKLEVLLGGRELMTGQESGDLDPNTEYFVRVTAFNGVGYGPGGITSPSFLPPVNQLPTQPYQVSARTVDESTIETSFASPDRDGGVALTLFRTIPVPPTHFNPSAHPTERCWTTWATWLLCHMGLY